MVCVCNTVVGLIRSPGVATVAAVVPPIHRYKFLEGINGAPA